MQRMCYVRDSSLMAAMWSSVSAMSLHCWLILNWMSGVELYQQLFTECVCVLALSDALWLLVCCDWGFCLSCLSHFVLRLNRARQGSVYFTIAFNITPISLMNLSCWLKSHYHWEYLDTWSLVQDELHAVELDLMFPLNSIPVSTPRYDSCLESSRWLN